MSSIKSFWMQKDKSECNDEYTMTSEITIRNGQIISSACDQCSDDPDSTNPCKSDMRERGLSCDGGSWTRFYPSRDENGFQIASINDAFANFYDPFINGLIRLVSTFTSEKTFG